MTKKITALKVQKRNKERVNVYLDGEFTFGLAHIVATWLKVGQELSEDKINALLAKDDVEVALQKALNFLSYRPRSAKEVRQNLIKHKADENTIEVVVERLTRGGMLNDNNFAEMWVESRSTFKPRGRKALRIELRQKGITDDVIEESLAELDEGELAYRAASKQARKLKHLEWQDFRKKLYGYLARRGFNYDTISGIIPKVWEEHTTQNQL